MPWQGWVPRLSALPLPLLQFLWRSHCSYAILRCFLWGARRCGVRGCGRAGKRQWAYISNRIPAPPPNKKNINKKEKIDISLFWIGGICLPCLQCLSSKSEDYPRSIDNFGSATNTSWVQNPSPGSPHYNLARFEYRSRDIDGQMKFPAGCQRCNKHLPIILQRCWSFCTSANAMSESTPLLPPTRENKAFSSF